MSERKMTAWERWELASFDGNAHAQKPVTVEAPPLPEVAPEPVPTLPTAEEIEGIYQQARDEGYAAGHAEGYAAGQAEGQAEVAAASGHLASALSQFDTQLSQFDEKLSEDILALAIDIAREVVRQHVIHQPDNILAVINDALALLSHHHVAIFLHPEDLALVRSNAGDSLTHSGHRLHEDTSLQRGDCRLEAGNTHVDGSLAARWRRVVATLGSEAPLIVDQRDES